MAVSGLRPSGMSRHFGRTYPEDEENEEFREVLALKVARISSTIVIRSGVQKAISIETAPLTRKQTLGTQKG
jgi:hypothetical protein